MELNPSPGSHLAMRSDLSHKGRGGAERAAGGLCPFPKGEVALSARNDFRILFPRLERTLRAAAGLLADFLGIDGAIELREAFDVRSGGAFRGYAGGRGGRVEFVGLAPFQRLFAGRESQFARARGDIDIAGPAHDGLGGDG